MSSLNADCADVVDAHDCVAERPSRATGPARLPGEAKTVLMITYMFPPAGYVGGYRTFKYCKYLHEFGWRPVVLTVDPRVFDRYDEGSWRDLPGHVDVFTTRELDPAKWLAQRGGWLRGRKPAITAASAHHDGVRPASFPSRLAGGLLNRLKLRIERLLFESPDSHLFWVPFAFVAGARILSTQRIDVIHCSSPPHSSHLAAYLLARCFRKPYVLDFRDPWDTPTTVVSANGRRMSRFQAALKRLIVSRAARVVAVSPSERAALVNEFPMIDADRFTSITNGYDPDDFAPMVPKRGDRARFVVTHTGTIYSGAGGELFRGIDLLLNQHPELRGVLRVNLIGGVAPEYDEAMALLMRDGTLVHQPFMPHTDALQAAVESDLLLILLGGTWFTPAEIPSKVFEYLACGKPILAVAAAGELSALLNRSRTGTVVPPGHPQRFADELWKHFVAWRIGRLRVTPDWSFVRSFERRTLTAQLSLVLDRAGTGREQHFGERRAGKARR
jgi:glycosyltransferase involved in cell wall biosynthesis